MKFPSVRVYVGYAIAAWMLIVAGAARGQEVTADLLKAAAKTAAGTLERKVETGPLVLREDYFQDKFKELHTIPVEGVVEPAKLTLRDSQRLLLVATEVAVTMLEVAEPDRANAALYQSAWVDAEQALLSRLVDVERPFLLTPNMRKIWAQFLAEWRAEVARVSPDRFRDALRQAAYSLVRIGLDIEAEWIQTVRDQGMAAAAGGEFAPAGVAPGPGAGVHWSPPMAYPHMYRRHYRIMNRIHRHYSRW